MDSDTYQVPGYVKVVVFHASDYSGETKIRLFTEEDKFEDLVIPAGLLPQVFRNVVLEFLRVTFQSLSGLLIHAAGKRNPWFKD